MNKLDKLAEKHYEWFHPTYPDGMTVANYCNDEIPVSSFIMGYEARDEEVRILREALCIALGSVEGHKTKAAKEALEAVK